MIVGPPAGTMAGQQSSLRAPNVLEVRRFKLECGVTGAWFAGEMAVFIGADRSLMQVPIGGRERLVAAHDDVILVSAGDGSRVATAGSDGRVLAIEPDGSIKELTSFDRNRWVSTIAVGDANVAYGIGRDLFVYLGDGSKHQRRSSSPVTAMQFSPDARTLAFAGRDGICLWSPETDKERHLRAGPGSTTSLCFSPDGLLLAETFYEPLLAVRGVEDDSILVMNGPPARVRSVSWASRSPTLLRSGVRHLVVCPILNKGGQLSTLPRLFAPYREQVTVVAHHPQQPLATVGYADGLVLLVRLVDGAEIVLKPPDGGTVAALAWSPLGRGLAIGGMDGQAILFVIDFAQ